ncbi:MAG: hypothetical protein OXD36_13920 [Rhodobacter sp.]|nr:hypothetical protein [Rhodobacter sp.]
MDKRFILPVAMLAGALALAGCGGGSDTPAASPTNPETTNPGTTTTTRAQHLNGTGLENTGTRARTIYIAAGDRYETPNEGTIDCPTGNTRCVITVAPGEGATTVTQTGGATFTAKKTEKEKTEETVDADDTTPAAPVARDQTPAPSGGASWLSAAALIKAVQQNDAGHVYVETETPNAGGVRGARDGKNAALGGVIIPVETAGGVFNGDAGVATGQVPVPGASPARMAPGSGSLINNFVVDTNDGYETDLRLVHTRDRIVINDEGEEVDDDRLANDYLVFGAWERRTSANQGPTQNPDIGYEYHGGIRRDVASVTTGDARYEGKALGHYSYDGGKWLEWDGTVALHANFAQRNISGEIKTGIPVSNLDTEKSDKLGPRFEPGLGTITLKKTAIGAISRGSLSLPDRANTPDPASGSVIPGAASSGTWEAQYYGSAIHGSPTGVAGEFVGTRRANPSGGTGLILHNQVAAEVRGAFGGHRVSQLPEDDVE